MRGPKLYLAMASCPTGWGYDPSRSVEEEKLAVATGLWPLKEAVNGTVRHTFVPRALTPVKEYLVTQERYAHLFRPSENKTAIAEIQGAINEYWSLVAKSESADVRLPV